MKANPDKCHFLSSLNTNTKISVSGLDIKNTHSKQIPGVIIDCKINFYDHVSNLCKKASAKTSVRVRVFPFIILSQKELIIKAIFNSQFGHCPLLWMNHNRTLNN